MASRVAKQDVELVQKISLPHPYELEPFIQRAPLPVLVRSCLEWLIDDASLAKRGQVLQSHMLNCET